MTKEFVFHIQEKLDTFIIKTRPLNGGCINETKKIETSKGAYFIKTNTKRNLLLKEKRGIEKIEATKTIKTPKIIVFGVFKDTEYLILEFIQQKNPDKNFWRLFGEKLAKLHKKHDKKHGLKYDNYIGTLAQKNTPSYNGVDFYIHNRILPQLNLLNKKAYNLVSSKFQKLFNLLPNLIPQETASLIHGDLWSGNYLVNKKEEPVIFDPAVYYGNREIDIAMTKLFGGFSQEFYTSYQSSFPLVSGWENRVEIWNLYPLLVHANLFGGGYINQVEFILKKYVS